MTHISEEKQIKWCKKSEKLILVGFSETTKGYRLCNTKTGQISTSRDVHIIEEKRNADSVHFFVEENTKGNDPNNYRKVYSNEDSSSESHLEQNSGELVFSEEELSHETYVPEDEGSLVVPENVRRSQRKRKTKNFEVKQANYEENPVSLGDPNSVTEPLAGPNRNKWISAMTDEMKSVSGNRAWDLVDLPESQSPVKCNWVFEEKVGSDSAET
ncbi:hypothetical protein JTB14_007480 [Gonioctena quinquepunctata]|nr:hypothetical protein JTB14_007480 [Gonioctena quinquepunctata]